MLHIICNIWYVYETSKKYIQENSYKRAHWDDDSESGSGSGSGSEEEECYIHADLDANEYLLKIDPGKNPWF